MTQTGKQYNFFFVKHSHFSQILHLKSAIYEMTVKNMSYLQMMPTAGGHFFSVHENKFTMRHTVLDYSIKNKSQSNQNQNTYSDISAV